MVLVRDEREGFIPDTAFYITRQQAEKWAQWGDKLRPLTQRQLETIARACAKARRIP